MKASLFRYHIGFFLTSPNVLFTLQIFPIKRNAIPLEDNMKEEPGSLIS